MAHAQYSMAKRPAITATKAKRLPAKKKEASGGRNPQRRARYLGQSTGGCMETPGNTQQLAWSKLDTVHRHFQRRVFLSN